MSKKCPKCATENFDSASVCRHCGEPLKFDTLIASETGLTNDNTQKLALDKYSKVLIAIIVFIVILIVFLVGLLLFSGSDSSEETPDAPISQAEQGDVNKLSAELDDSDSGKSNMITGVNDIPSQDWDSFISVTSVELDSEKAELEEGETLKLTATVMPKDASVQTISWLSGDTSVATVDDNGNVKAVAEGKTKIYVYTYDGEFSDSCEVTVKSKKQLIEPQSIADYGKYIVKVDTYLSLRYGPGIEYDEIKRIDNGEVLTVYAYQNDTNSNTWAYVKYNGKFGWVYDNFLISKTQTTEPETEEDGYITDEE